MKMKDVLAKTGLTDRAVRLYIAQELVFPSGTENYSGRRSFDFSERDVQRLRQIALLRSADFSIADIRRMFSDTSSVVPVLRAQIERSEASVRRKHDVLQALRSLPQTDDLTVEDVCAHLRFAAVEQDVPERDLRAKSFVLRERRSYRRFGAGLLLAVLAALILIPVFWRVQYRYWSASDGWVTGVWLLYHGWLWVAGVGAALLRLNRRKGRISERKTKLSGILVLLCLSTAWVVLLITVASYGFLAPFFFSQTDDPNDYGVLDRAVERHYLAYTLPDGLFDAVFPDCIPDAARLPESAFPQEFPASVRYHYDYIDCFDAQIDVAAQWTLPEAEYHAAKADAPSAPVQTAVRGSWTCLYYADTEQTTDHDCTYLIFAYNDETHTVRYLFFYTERADLCAPYFSQMDWS